jgi:cell division protein FtsQ
MTAATARRSGKNKVSKSNKAASKATTRRKVRQLSWLDRFVRTLPFSESEVQRFFTWALIASGALLMLVAAHYLGVTKFLYQQYARLAVSAGFQVKRVEPTGMVRVDQLKVYDLILEPMDTAMPLVDIDKIRDDLLKYGWIKEARVSRRLPDTLVVDITERKPTAVWQRDGKLSLIDDQGVVLEDISANKTGGLPMLNGAGANLQAVALAELLDKARSLKSQVSGASWVGNRRWDLTFKTGETIALPEGEKVAAEALLNFARMDGIHRLLGRDIIHFDLRDPARAYLRKRPKLDPAKLEAPKESNSKAPKTNKETA